MNNPFSLSPASRAFGFDRGKPIDRYYIENFLERNQSSITGDVLEVGDNTYTKTYGHKITKSDVLNVIPSPHATIVGDLATGENIPEAAFDCIILTQVIHVIYDVKSALRNTMKALKPGGVLLLTTAGISPSCREHFHGDYWRFTRQSLKWLLHELAPKKFVKVDVYGNIAVAKAFLDGLALHEVPQEILDYQDEDYQVVLTARVTKHR